MNEYQEQILDHYKNPRHAGVLATYTYKKKLKNLSCGDEVEVYLLIEDGIIKDASFVGIGCSISIASASLLLDEVIGMSLNDFEKFDLDRLLQILGIQLTTSRLKCANLSLDAAKQAVSN